MMLKGLRNRLVALCLRPIYQIIGDVTYRESKNIQRRLQYIALEETALYVRQKMWHVNSVADRYQLLALSLSQVNRIEGGLYCEFGVYEGASINYLASLTEQPFYGFDSFEGLPERWGDGFDKGRFKVAGLPIVRPNVTLIKGRFNQTIPSFLEKHPQPIAFLNIDCDLYTSTKVIFDLLGHRLVPGSVIVFDEYFNYPGWQEGEFKAFAEFVSTHQIKYDYLSYNRSGEQVAVKIREVLDSAPKD